MTSAHRPTLDPAKGKLVPETGIIYDRMLPGYTKLKMRQPGQGGAAGGLSPENKQDTEDSVSETLAIEPAPPEDVENSANPSSPSDEDSAYESDNEEDLRKELQKLRDIKSTKHSQEEPKAKKRSWADETVFSNQQISTPEPHRINDSLRSHKTKKFINKYVQ